MKKTWVNAEVEELNIQETAGGTEPSYNFDGPWQQREDGSWWIPGADPSNSES